MSRKNKTIAGSIVTLLVFLLIAFVRSSLFDTWMGEDGEQQEVVLAEATEKPKETAAPKETEEPKETTAPKETEEPKETAAPKNTEEPKETAKPKTTEKPKQTAESKETTASKETENPPETASEAGTESTLQFRSKKLLNQHYEKHGIEMGFASAQEYEEAAAAVVANPDALHKTEKEDGDDVYYLESTNEFVIVSTDGYLRTYFLPSGGIKYYNKQ